VNALRIGLLVRHNDFRSEQSKDLRRSSDGARLGLILLAEEPRIRVAVLSAGGLSPGKKPLEIDEINFAPRVRVPVLMLNGRYDFMFAAESDQAQMFRLLGTPEKDKRYVLYNSGHVPVQQQEIKETLDWFDRYLGPTGK
jgi:eukaryotic-like serine/threonine-protein kinase